ncbi:MAG: ABC transporter ATP-binding protein [Gemmatimonadaceae bacterium]|nr:ABC transporter ATP-binding protein [Gemmatimonadaceae bacterium]
MLSVQGVHKQFAVRRPWVEALRNPRGATRVAALEDVSFEVNRGEIFGLLGPNGAGKTTLLKILATLIDPDAGRVRVDGHDAQREPAAVRQLLAPVLANERSLYWRLSALENLRLYAALQGLDARAARAECQRLLALVGLDDHSIGARLVATFSSGMRQRLLIARALLARPRVLLLDEPTRSLDPISARAFRQFLRDTVVQQEGCTVLLATHDADEVWELCQRVGVLARGRLLAVDATSTLRHRAASGEYEVWVRHSEISAATEALSSDAVSVSERGGAAEPGWSVLQCTIPGGAEESSRALSRLAARGIVPARFDYAPPSLAALIDRVVQGAGSRDA